MSRGRTTRAAILALLLVAVGLIVGVTLTTCALAHDSWISRGGLRNAAGEWCCGEQDCFVIPSELVRIVQGLPGYVIIDREPKAGEGPPNIVEIVPFEEAQPSPDGAYWRCKRPDGSRRCFFAPPPNT